MLLEELVTLHSDKFAMSSMCFNIFSPRFLIFFRVWSELVSASFIGCSCHATEGGRLDSQEKLTLFSLAYLLTKTAVTHVELRTQMFAFDMSLKMDNIMKIARS